MFKFGGKTNTTMFMLIIVLTVVVSALYLMASSKQEKAKKLVKSSVDIAVVRQKKIEEENRKLKKRLQLLEKEQSQYISREELSGAVNRQINKLLSEKLKDIEQQLKMQQRLLRQKAVRTQKQSYTPKTVRATSTVIYERKKPTSIGSAIKKMVSSSKKTIGSWSGVKRAYAKGAQQLQTVDAREGLPIGTIIPCRLDNALVSMTRHEVPVTATVAKDIVYKGIVVIPRGSKFVGTAYPDFDAHKLYIHINVLVIKNVEIPVKGILLDAKKMVGVADKYFDPLVAAMQASVFPSFLAAMAQSFVEMHSTPGIIGALTEMKNSTTNAALNGLTAMLGQQSALQQKIMAREKPRIYAYAGHKVFVFLQKKLPLSDLE